MQSTGLGFGIKEACWDQLQQHNWLSLHRRSRKITYSKMKGVSSTRISKDNAIINEKYFRKYDQICLLKSYK